MKKLFLIILAAIVLIGVYLAAWPVSVDPVSWNAPENKGFVGDFAPNTDLANLEYLPMGESHGPEDVVMHEGKLYVSSQEGKIIEIDPAAKTHREYADTKGSALGMEMDAQGNLIIADAFRGLLAVSPQGQVSVLTDEVDGTPILYADDLDIAADGVIYFSDASTKFGAKASGDTLGASVLEISEHRGTGRLLAYNPATKRTRVVKDGYVFSNGVAMTSDGDILVNETGTYQMHRVSPDGRSRVIMDNLPGFPDNVNRGPKLADGTETFLLGIVSQRSKWLDDNSENVGARKMAMRLPAFMRPQAVNYGLIVQIDGEGNVLKTWQDPSGSYPSATGAIIAEDGYMYVSSLTAPELGRLKIK
ncbi:SMP-30/gluconolactonase/LRE family protein [Hellea sp.]|nr:SMP-30/gluconolactonase/LRE family protein [Hellea sp.]